MAEGSVSSSVLRCEGEVLSVSIEEGNSDDGFAVCTKRGNLIVGNVPREIPHKVLYLLQLLHFLRHGGQSTCEITGRRKRENGMEVSCVSLCSKATVDQKAQNFASAFRPLRVMPGYSLFVVVRLFSLHILLGLYISQRNRHRPQIVATPNVPRNKYWFMLL